MRSTAPDHGNNIEGKAVVITGASSGLGEATARFLSAEGATGAWRQDRFKALAERLASAGVKAFTVTTDVTDRARVKRLVARSGPARSTGDAVLPE